MYKPCMYGCMILLRVRVWCARWKGGRRTGGHLLLTLKTPHHPIPTPTHTHTHALDTHIGRMKPSPQQTHTHTHTHTPSDDASTSDELAGLEAATKQRERDTIASGSHANVSQGIRTK